MPGLLSWLGGQVEGAFAQVNPWDNGADYNSVQRQRAEEERRRREMQQRQVQDAQQRIRQGGTGTPYAPQVIQQAQQQNQTQGQFAQAGRTDAPRPLNPLVNTTRNSVVNQTKPLNIGGLSYTKNADGTYTSNKGAVRTAEQIQKLQQLDQKYAAKQQQIDQQGVNPLNVAKEVVKAPFTVAGGAANAVKDIGTGMVNDWGNRMAQAGEAGGQVLGEITGQNQKLADTHSKIAQGYDQMSVQWLNRMKNAQTPQEYEKYRRAYISSELAAQNERDLTMQGIQESAAALDPRTTLTNAAMTALDAATAGKGKALLEGANLISKVSGQTLKQLGKNTLITGAQGGAIGGSYGALGTAQDPNATLIDYLRNTAIGAGAGAGLGIGAQIALPVAGVAGRASARGIENTAKYVANDTNNTYIKPIKQAGKAIKAATPEQIAQHPVIQQMDSHIEGLKQQFRSEPNQLVRNRLQKAILQATEQRKADFRQLQKDAAVQAARATNDAASNFIPAGRLKSTGADNGLSPKSYREHSKEMRKAIDAQIQKDNPELGLSSMRESPFPNGIPKVRPEDIKAATGLTAREAGIPPRYLSKDATPLDQLTADYERSVLGNTSGQLTMDTQDYLLKMSNELDANASKRGDARKITELRNSPDVISKAKAALEAERAYYGTQDSYQPSKKDLAEYSKVAGDTTLQKAAKPTASSKVKTTSAKAASRGVRQPKNDQKLSGSAVDSPSANRQQSSQVLAPSSKSAVKTSTNPRDSVQPESQSKVLQKGKEVSTLVDRTYVDNTTNITKKRGFTTSVKSSPEVSNDVRKKVSGEYNVRSTKKLAESANSYANGNLRKVTAEVNSVLDTKLGTISDQDVADALAVAKRLDGQNRFDESQTIYDKLAEHGTKGGQAIQAFSLLQNRTPEGVKFQMLRNLKKAGVTLTSEDQKQVGKLIDNVRKTKPNTEARNRALFETLDYVSKKMPSNRGDKIINFWRAGLLTAPKTTGGNLLGNAGEAAVRELYTNPIAVATDKFFSIFTGKRTKTLGGGQIAGLKEGTTRGIDYMKTGYDTRNVGSKYDAPRRVNYKNETIDAYVNGVYRWMGTQDQPFYYSAKAAAAHDLAKADGINLGYKGEKLANYVEQSTQDSNWKPQTFKSAKDATEYAKYAVYQNDTLLGSIAAGVKNAADKKGMRWAADFILPFTQVPSSIAVRVIDRTPVGTAREIASQIKNKSFDQRAMAEAIGNGSFGIPVIAAGAALAKNGEITGDYPTDSKERKLWEAEGKQPYSVKIGNRWYSLNYLQPFGTILNIGRQVQQDIESGKSSAEAWMAATASAAQSISDQSFLKGLNGIMNAIQDPERSASSFINSTVGSAVPNFVRSFSTAIDSNKREIGSPVDALVASVPFARNMLPAKQDMFGAPQKANDTPINQYLNPLRPSRVKGQDDKLVKELRRLQDADNGIVTTSFTKKSIGGVELNDKQVRDLNMQVNSAVRQAWDTTIDDPRYAKLTDEEKNTALKRVKDNIADGVKADFVKQNGLNSTSDYKASKSNPFSTSKSNVTISDKLSAPSKQTLDTYYSMDSTQREQWFAKKNDNEYKYYKAKYENDKANGSISKIEDVQRRRYLKKDEVGSKYTKDTRDLYKLSKADIETYLGQSKNADKLANELVAYDRALYDAGLTKYLKFKYGTGSSSGGRRSSGRRSGGGGGSRGNGITAGKAIVSLSSSLNKLQAPRTTGGQTSATRGVSLPQMRKQQLKKYTVQNARFSSAPLKITSKRA